METAMTFGNVVNGRAGDDPGSMFHIAILGDVSGRANRGEFEIGDSIANRKAIAVEALDIDEAVAKIGPRLRIPIVNGDSFVDLEFNSFDDFHADEIFRRVDLIDNVQGLGRRVERSIEKALSLLDRWSNVESSRADVSGISHGVVIPLVESIEEFGSVEIAPTVPVDAKAMELGAILERVGAPWLKPIAGSANPTKEKLLSAASNATNAFTRTILHHPDFQSVEGAWQELSWLLRRVVKGRNVRVSILDITAEEFAADLTAVDELEKTGVYRLLVENTAEGVSSDPWSAIVGRYQFDYRPAHAEVLGRMAKIAQRVHAPFLSGIDSRLVDESYKPEKDESAKSAWDQLRDISESKYVGLVLPRFLVRLPYGKKWTTVETFDLEEWTKSEGNDGYLWGCGGSICACLLALSYSKDGSWNFKPGIQRVLEQMPMHVVHERDGIVAAVCAEIGLKSSLVEKLAHLGIMALRSNSDRATIELATFRSLNVSSSELQGRWGQEGGAPSVGSASTESAPGHVNDSVTTDKDNGSDADSEMDPELAAMLAENQDGAAGDPSTDVAGGMDPELTALLAEDDSAGDATASSGDTEMDPELAALLANDNDSETGSQEDEMDPELAALLANDNDSETGSQEDEMDPELAALLANDNDSETDPHEDEMDPELAALLAEEQSREVDDSSVADDEMDPELAALLADSDELDGTTSESGDMAPEVAAPMADDNNEVHDTSQIDADVAQDNVISNGHPFEYKVVQVSTIGELTGLLNELGPQGWEMVTGIPNDNEIHAFFKRCVD